MMLITSGLNRLNLDVQDCTKFVIIILIVSSNVANALHAFKETPIPEALLKPRNFNPHPYEQHFPHQHLHHHLHHQHQQQAIDINAISTVGEDYVDNSIYNDVSAPRETSLPALHPANGIFSQGPVQFPPSLPPNNNLRNLPHPYASLKYKNEIGRGNVRLNEIVDDSFSNLPKKQYAFSYTVRDHHSGDDFSHTQQQKNGAVKGTYKVQLPDGRTQVVRYTADNDGYRADVSYLIDKNAVDQSSPLHNRNEYANYLVNVPEQPSYQQPEQPSYQPEQPSYHYSYNSYGQHQNHLNSESAAVPAPTSSIFVSTVQPPTAAETSPLHTVFNNNNDINLELSKSISSRPTYVVSAKSTHVADNGFIVTDPVDPVDENVVLRDY